MSRQERAKQENKKLYTMELGDSLIIEDSSLLTTVLRVPGGWFYRSLDKNYGILTGVFVPFNNEFQAKEK